MGMILAAVVNVVLPGLATALGSLALAVLNKYLKKVTLALTAEQQAQIARLVEDAVLSVEELARRDRQMTSAEKASVAKGIVVQGYPDLADDVVERMIDATLQRVRKTPSPTVTFTNSLPMPIGYQIE
jgi:hypothetical protein